MAKTDKIKSKPLPKLAKATHVGATNRVHAHPKTEKNPKGRGRPLGMVAIKSRLIAQGILGDDGLTPLEVMIQNMRWYHEDCTKLYEKIIRHMSRKSDEERMDDEELMNMFKNMLFARNRSQQCAKDAAPYMHSQLARVEHDFHMKGDFKVEKIERVIVDPGDPQIIDQPATEIEEIDS